MAKNRQSEVFRIREANREPKLKNISPITHFHGRDSKDPNTSMFEFSIVFRIYDDTSNENKLKLFPSILKDVALCWFMSLEGGNITTWAQM